MLASCLRKLRKLRGETDAAMQALIFKPNSWLEAFYQELCAYTHSRPDSSDGKMWKSNGPIYVTAAFNLVFQLQASTYVASCALTKVGRPDFTLPKAAAFLFRTPNLLWRDDIASSYDALCSIRSGGDTGGS